mgnify:CR=1 FL=1
MERESLVSTLKTSNLLLAALLESSGGHVTSIAPRSRYSLVTVDLSSFSKEILEEKTSRLSRVVANIEDNEEWVHLFNNTFLGEVEDRYVRLKKRVVRERSK